MPQFNWSVFGPILLALAAVAGGIAFLVSLASPHSSHHAFVTAATVPIHAAFSPTVTTVLQAPPRGVRLSAIAAGSPHLRAAPSSDAAVVGDLKYGEAVQVSGCSASCDWYLVTPSGQAVSGWVSAAFVTVQGDDRALPVIR